MWILTLLFACLTLCEKNESDSLRAKDLNDLLTNRKSPYIVIGNEGADIDSIGSSMLYAVALSKKTNNIILPIINMKRSQFHLHQDSVYIILKIGLSFDNLIFIDEIDMRDIKSVVLVDHNELPPKQKELHSKVVEIVDHHVDSYSFDNTIIKDIRKSGSCMTLIADHIFSMNFHLDDKFAYLLLAIISVDTHNFDGTLFFSSLDEHFANVYAAQLNYTLFDRQGLYNFIIEKRNNVSSLSTYEKLELDVKFSYLSNGISFSISAVPQSIDLMLQDSNFFQEVAKYRKDKHVTFIVIYTLFKNDNNVMAREILFFVPDTSFIETLIKNIEVINEQNQTLLNLVLVQLPKVVGKCVHSVLFHQLQTMSSRKQLFPFINQATATIETVFGVSSNLLLKAFEKMNSELEMINNATLPSTVKPARKSILNCRTLVDIFAPLYNQDELISFRSTLNKGYTLIGIFQDLFASGVEYGEEEMEKLRSAFIDWKLSFAVEQQTTDFEYFLSHPSNHEFVVPSKASQLFWGLFKNSKIECAMVENVKCFVGQLLSTQLQTLLDKVRRMGEVKSIVKDHVEFHFSRKLTRSIIDLTNSINPWKEESGWGTSMDTLLHLKNEYGDLNDIYMKYLYYVNKKGGKGEAKSSEDVLDDRWKEVRKWCEDGTVERAIRKLLLIIHTNYS